MSQQLAKDYTDSLGALGVNESIVLLSGKRLKGQFWDIRFGRRIDRICLKLS